jgi:hypothetical protein
MKGTAEVRARELATLLILLVSVVLKMRITEIHTQREPLFYLDTGVS